MASWTLDLFFGQQIEQMITVRDIEALSSQLARIRARTKSGSRNKTRAAQETFVFNHRPDVQRVIFISTPHRGSDLASNWIGRIGAALVRTPRLYIDLRLNQTAPNRRPCCQTTESHAK